MASPGDLPAQLPDREVPRLTADVETQIEFTRWDGSPMEALTPGQVVTVDYGTMPGLASLSGRYRVTGTEELPGGGERYTLEPEAAAEDRARQVRLRVINDPPRKVPSADPGKLGYELTSRLEFTRARP